MMSLSQSYTLADVRRWYSMPELQRAKAYLNSIGYLDIQPNKISAEVKGTALRPYLVEIFFATDTAGNLSIDPRCTCPVQWKCKHTAVVLLSALSVPRAPTVSNAVLEWIESFRRAAKSPHKKKPKAAVKSERLCYALTKSPYTAAYLISIYKGKTDAAGHLLGALEEWSNVERALIKPPQYVTEEDLLILRMLWKQRDKKDGFVIIGPQGNEILSRLLESGRLYFIERIGSSGHAMSAPIQLKQGELREARLDWGVDAEGRMVPTIIRSGAPVIVLPMPEATWYVDGSAGEIGQLKLAQTPAQIVQLLNMPPLSEIDVPVVTEALREMVPDLPQPSTDRLRTIKQPLVPMLLLDTVELPWMGRYRSYSYGAQQLDFMRIKFRYGEAVLSLDHAGEFVTLKNGETVRVTRNKKSEANFVKPLAGYGLEEVPGYGLPGDIVDRPIFALESEQAWPPFMQQVIPQMRAAGWEIVVPQGFRHHVLEVEAWEAEFEEEQDGWFSLNMGIVVNGQRLPLAPLLHELFKVDSRWLDAAHLDSMPDAERVELQLPDGGRVNIPAERIKPLARTLIELFDGKGGAEIRMSRYDVARIDALVGMERWQFKGADAVQNLAHKLKNTSGIKPAIPPEGFALQLRPYQLEGLSWLQYLREQDLAGILADDMGWAKPHRRWRICCWKNKAGAWTSPRWWCCRHRSYSTGNARRNDSRRSLSCSRCTARKELITFLPFLNTMSFLPPIRCCGAMKKRWRSMSTIC